MAPIHHQRRGISLVEVVLSIPLVGLVLVGAMTSTGAVLRTWNQARDSYDAASLAASLMTEVIQQPYEDPDDTPAYGLESGESGGDRKDFDDIDDYHGWSMSPPEDKEKNEIDDHDGWTRAASVAYARLSDPTQTSPTDEGLKRITVTVTDPAGNVTTLTAYRSRWGALEQPPATDATLQTYISHELKMKKDAYDNQLILHGGTHVLNYAE